MYKPCTGNYRRAAATGGFWALMIIRVNGALRLFAIKRCHLFDLKGVLLPHFMVIDGFGLARKPG
ncbi:hypothetical protein [Niabella hirudinis]|uniref:hypothetical protein n=1 Tax=Niabella hirudinis TaxID=1285929 RepID=UPI003EBF3F99